MEKAGSACILQCMPSTTFLIWFPTPPHSPSQSPHHGGPMPASRPPSGNRGLVPLACLCRAFRSRLWACVHAPRTSPTPNPKVSTARHTHPPPSASHGMRHERGHCRQIDGRCQICIIRIACSCHSTLIHAHDMRLAACHPCI